MRNIATVAISLVLLVPSLALAISLCQYTQPITTVTTSSLQLNGRYLDDEYLDDRGNVLSLTLAGNFLRYYDAPDFGYGVKASFSHSTAEGERTLVGAASADFRFYAPETALFAFGRVNSNWVGLTPTVAVVLGIGYGRLQDVTPLVKAVRINDKLIQDKVLTAALPDDVLLAIAQEIGKRQEYPSLEDLVIKVVELIEASGAVPGKLGAEAVLAIRQIITAVGDTRLCGFSLSTGVGYKVLDPAGQQDLVLFEAAEYAMPWSVDTQLYLRGDVTSTLNFSSYVMQVTASLVHKLTSTATLSGNFSFSRALPAGGTPVDSQALDVALSFALFEGWTVNVTLGIRNLTGYEEPRVELSVAAGITF